MTSWVRRLVAIITVGWCAGCGPRPAYTPPSLSPPRSVAEKQVPVTVYTYHVTMVTPAQHNPLEFRDETLQIRFMPRETVLEFAVYNLGTRPVVIVWDQAAYIDAQGVSHPIIHKGVLLADTSRRQTPTMVMPQGVLNETIAPVDYIYNSSSGWRQRPMFPKTEESQKLKGTTFGVILPIKTQETVKPYTFQFQITDVEVTTMMK
ncbi:MAG: hypothetical protein HY710_07355 [Candidatus Latescibacteria bacterium]|nr:hypothetical protein [Candidatus Latescibacterota bacterium]